MTMKEFTWVENQLNMLWGDIRYAIHLKKISGATAPQDQQGAANSDHLKETKKEMTQEAVSAGPKTVRSPS